MYLTILVLLLTPSCLSHSHLILLDLLLKLVNVSDNPSTKIWWVTLRNDGFRLDCQQKVISKDFTDFKFFRFILYVWSTLHSYGNLGEKTTDGLCYSFLKNEITYTKIFNQIFHVLSTRLIWLVQFWLVLSIFFSTFQNMNRTYRRLSPTVIKEYLLAKWSDKTRKNRMRDLLIEHTYS